MQLPKVSVIIPIYNAAPIIESSITNLLKQTYKNLEVIMVDDSSMDNSYIIAKHFETENVTVLKQPNSGAAVARNLGLRYASGDYIQFMDIDDFLSHDKIEKQVEALNGDYDRIAICNYLSFFHENEISSLYYNNDQNSFIYSTEEPIDFLLNLYGGNGTPYFIQTNCWLVPRQLIEKAGKWRSYRCPDDDGEFFARVILASKGIIYVPGTYNFYRRTITDKSLSQNKQTKYLMNTLLTIDLKHHYLLRYTNDKKIDKAIATQYLHFAVSVYPTNKLLSKVAYKRYKSFNIKISLPILGGNIIEGVKFIFGWKVAKLIKSKYYKYM
jgi:glycosyltransferase involved in cell wall biosynthesis